MSTELQRQARLIQALNDARRFPRGGSTVEVIETHISWVLLCGEFAYKIKKSVDLGFLDFTTLERRHHFCREELRLNRRLAPDIYLDVIGIGGSPEQPLLEQAQDVWEYAVLMRRFDQDRRLDHLLQRQAVEPRTIDELAATVAEFHGRMPSAAEGGAYGSAARIAAPMLENFRHFQADGLRPDLQEGLQALKAWFETTLAQGEHTLDQRLRDGFVRECHGDMHSGNIAVQDESIVIFDGIEFDPNLYWIDVMSEIAFLMMDLEEHGRRDYAYRFLNAYLSAAGDYAGVAVLRLYLAYRAMVRAKIAFLQGEAGTMEAYVQLALRYTRPAPPLLCITHGLSGSGKTFHSLALAQRLGAVHMRSDRERLRLFSETSAQGVGRGRYAPQASDRVYAHLRECAGVALSAGFLVIVDAAFLQADRRQAFRDLAERSGARWRILSYTARESTLRARIERRRLSRQDWSEADQHVLDNQLQQFQPPGAAEVDQVVQIDTESTVDDEAIIQQLLAP